MSQVAERTAGAERLQALARRWTAVPRPTLADALRSALDDGRSVLLVGDGGVGKTHLVETVLAAGVPHPRTPVEQPGAGGAEHGAQAGPSADDVPVDVVSLSAAALLAGEPLALQPRAGSRLVVRVEDAHLLGDQDALALARLARAGAAQLVLTLRGAGASRTPWLELWKDGIADRVDVPPFTRTETEELLTAALDGPLGMETFRRLWERSRGNGFYLRELVRTELEEGDLARRDGIWVGSVQAAPGARVLDLVRSELARLDGPTREALDLVALAETVPVRVLGDLVEDGVLDRLVHEGLVVVSERGQLETGLLPAARVAHPMYAEAVRELVPLDRRRRLYATMRATQTSPAAVVPETNLLRMVVWALECGVRETSERLLAAMRVAAGLHRWELVVQVGSAALRRVPESAPGPRADVLMLRAHGWRLLNRIGDAQRDLREAQRLLEAAGGLDPERLLHLTEQQADLDQFHDDDVDAALDRLALVRERLAGAGVSAAVQALDVSRLARLGQAGRFTESLEPSLELLRAPDAADLVLVNPAVVGLGQVGRLDEAVALAERFELVAAAHPEGSPQWTGVAIGIAHFLARLWSGDVAGAEQVMRPGDGTRLSTYDAFGHMGRGLIAAAHGRWTDARREHQAASARFAVADPAGIAAYATAAEAVAVAATGDATTARALIEEARGAPLRMSAAVESDLRLLLLDAGAWLRLPTQHADAVRLARWCAERGLHRTELEALHRAVVAGAGAGTARAAAVSDEALLARMRELAGLVTGARARCLVRHAAAVVARDEQLAQVGAAELGRHGLWLPTSTVCAELTRREREIAGLAAGGLSSRAIAERLTVSVRTVDSHLSRVFAKLGVRSRRELAAVLYSGPTQS